MPNWLARTRNAMTPDTWMRVWRIAVVALLAWIALELHWLRSESNSGLDYRTEQLLDSIENNTQDAADALRRR